MLYVEFCFGSSSIRNELVPMMLRFNFLGVQVLWVRELLPSTKILKLIEAGDLAY